MRWVRAGRQRCVSGDYKQTITRGFVFSTGFAQKGENLFTYNGDFLRDVVFIDHVPC